MRRARSKLEVSTFPFLAVLLAAMGALIFLLLVLDRRAKLVAHNKVREIGQARAQERAKKEAERLEAWQREQDEFQRRQEYLIREQETIAQGLAEQDKSLRGEWAKVQSELEMAADSLKKEELNALRLLRDQDNLRKWLAESTKNLEARRRVANLTKEQEDAAASSLARMIAELARMEKILQDLKTRPKKDNVFSLVPYRGKQGADRKPIYVECAAAGVVFQPQGRRLTLDELEQDRIREEIRRGGLDMLPEKDERPEDPPRPRARPDKTDPYLLCLVRPDGVETYGRFLKALNGYDVDFGYEFIDAHWELDFTNQQLAGTEPTAEGSRPARTAAGVPASRSGGGKGVVGTESGTPGKAASGSGPGVVPPTTGPPTTGRPGLGFLETVPASPSPAGKGGVPGKSGFGGTGVPDGGPDVKKDPNTSAAAKGTYPAGSPTEAPSNPLPGGKPGAEKSAGEQKKGLAEDVAWRGSKAPGREGTVAGKDPPRKDGPREGMGGEPREPGEPDEPAGSEETRPLPRDPLATAVSRPPSLGQMLANRDFIIHIACTETDAILKLTGEGYSSTGSAEEHTQNALALVEVVRKMIARRQASLRPGEPPYRPLIRFQVYPGGLRTYYRFYPLFEPLRLPMTRENIE